MGRLSVVDPSAAAVLPAVELTLAEPQIDFLLGVLNRVAAVYHVPVKQSQHVSRLRKSKWLVNLDQVDLEFKIL